MAEAELVVDYKRSKIKELQNELASLELKYASEDVKRENVSQLWKESKPVLTENRITNSELKYMEKIRDCQRARMTNCDVQLREISTLKKKIDEALADLEQS